MSATNTHHVDIIEGFFSRPGDEDNTRIVNVLIYLPDGECVGWTSTDRCRMPNSPYDEPRFSPAGGEDDDSYYPAVAAFGFEGLTRYAIDERLTDIVEEAEPGFFDDDDE